MINVLKPDMPSVNQLLPYLKSMATSHQYTNFGPLVTEFEQRLLGVILSSKNNPKNLQCVTASSGTSALELALSAYQFPKGSRVIVPAFTFPATITAVINAGYQPLIVDVDAKSWLLTPDIAESIMQSVDARLILPVCALGLPQNLYLWTCFYKKFNIPVLIDAAAAIGGQSADEGINVVFSFHATKPLGIGEGGAVLSCDAEWLADVRTLSNFGFSSGQVKKIGTNAKLSEYHAAVGLAQLDRWHENVKWRTELAQNYFDQLGLAMFEFTMPNQQAIVPGVFCIAIENKAQQLCQQLKHCMIETRRWYHPILPYHCAFKPYVGSEPYVTADYLNESLVGLPFYRQINKKMVKKIISSIESLL